MTEPLVSVKMITYNHAPYIAQAIKGVIQQQTDFPFELVIGEDCSTDGTRDIVFDYQKRHPDVIRVVTSERNVGMKRNSYRTGRACRGKYIAFCEGDDYWHHPLKLQKQVDYLEGHPECGLVYSDFDTFDVGTGLRVIAYNRQHGRKPAEQPTLTDLLNGKCGILTCTVCARRKLVDDVIASDPELYASPRFLMGDTPLWGDILCQAKVHYIDVSLSTYRLLPESAAHSKMATKQHRFYRSNSEMRVYMARKHGLSLADIESYERDLADASLFLAFLEKDAEMGMIARRQLSRPTVRQRLLFWGSQGLFVNGVLRAGWCIQRLLRSRFSAGICRRA